MNTVELIEEIKKSFLYAECSCGEEFKLSEAIIFDGTKPFPEEAIQKQMELLQELKDRAEELEKRKKCSTKKAENTAKCVNVGKSLEKILPTLKDFKWDLPDCRFLGCPIDLITFNGISSNKIQSISFIEVKTGDARLNAHQKSVRDAVNDKKVIYKVIP